MMVADSEVITLEFLRRNEELIRIGLKRATTRRSIHGRIGSVFRAAGRFWMIRAIVPLSLGEASQQFFFLEGESSASSFLDWWCTSYGIPKADPATRVYVHIFQEAP